MTYEQFWYGDPWIARAFRKKWRLQLEKENHDMWMMGLYINNAVSAAIANNFDKKRHSYIEEPLRIFPLTEEEQKAQMEKEARETFARLTAMAAAAGYHERKE